MQQKRSCAQRQNDLFEIERMYFCGHSKLEMAEALGFTKSQVCRDLKDVQNRWKEKALEPKIACGPGWSPRSI
jgi:hypothetical protein